MLGDYMIFLESDDGLVVPIKASLHTDWQARDQSQQR
jgi:hypothetical protein